jgi:hypothetical protein
MSISISLQVGELFVYQGSGCVGDYDIYDLIYGSCMGCNTYEDVQDESSNAQVSGAVIAIIVVSVLVCCLCVIGTILAVCGCVTFGTVALCSCLRREKTSCAPNVTAQQANGVAYANNGAMQYPNSAQYPDGAQYAPPTANQYGQPVYTAAAAYSTSPVYNPALPAYSSPPVGKLEVESSTDKYQELPAPAVASAVPAHSQGSEILSVMIPHDAGNVGGTVMQAINSRGQPVQFVVPANAVPGQLIQIQVNF